MNIVVIEKAVSLIVTAVSSGYGVYLWQKKQQEKKEKESNNNLKKLIHEEVKKSEIRMINNFEEMTQKMYAPLVGEILEIKNILEEINVNCNL